MTGRFWLTDALERIARMPYKTRAQREARSEVLRRAIEANRAERIVQATRGTEAS
jgi:hypothetical protein